MRTATTPIRQHSKPAVFRSTPLVEAWNLQVVLLKPKLVVRFDMSFSIDGHPFEVRGLRLIREGKFTWSVSLPYLRDDDRTVHTIDLPAGILAGAKRSAIAKYKAMLTAFPPAPARR